MGVKVHVRDAKSTADVKAMLAKVGMTMTASQKQFLEDHDGHRGLVFEHNRAYCRTCNKRDGQ